MEMKSALIQKLGSMTKHEAFQGSAQPLRQYAAKKRV
jgi:hypothetical protein